MKKYLVILPFILGYNVKAEQLSNVQMQTNNDIVQIAPINYKNDTEQRLTNLESKVNIINQNVNIINQNINKLKEQYNALVQPINTQYNKLENNQQHKAIQQNNQNNSQNNINTIKNANGDLQTNNGVDVKNFLSKLNSCSTTQEKLDYIEQLGLQNVNDLKEAVVKGEPLDEKIIAQIPKHLNNLEYKDSNDINDINNITFSPSATPFTTDNTSNNYDEILQQLENANETNLAQIVTKYPELNPIIEAYHKEYPNQPVNIEAIKQEVSNRRNNTTPNSVVSTNNLDNTNMSIAPEAPHGNESVTAGFNNMSPQQRAQILNDNPDLLKNMNENEIQNFVQHGIFPQSKPELSKQLQNSLEKKQREQILNDNPDLLKNMNENEIQNFVQHGIFPDSNLELSKQLQNSLEQEKVKSNIESKIDGIINELQNATPEHRQALLSKYMQDGTVPQMTQEEINNYLTNGVLPSTPEFRQQLRHNIANNNKDVLPETQENMSQLQNNIVNNDDNENKIQNIIAQLNNAKTPAARDNLLQKHAKVLAFMTPEAKQQYINNGQLDVDENFKTNLSNYITTVHNSRKNDRNNNVFEFDGSDFDSLFPTTKTDYSQMDKEALINKLQEMDIALQNCNNTCKMLQQNKWNSEVVQSNNNVIDNTNIVGQSNSQQILNNVVIEPINTKNIETNVLQNPDTNAIESITAPVNQEPNIIQTGSNNSEIEQPAAPVVNQQLQTVDTNVLQNPDTNVIESITASVNQEPNIIQTGSNNSEIEQPAAPVVNQQLQDDNVIQSQNVMPTQSDNTMPEMERDIDDNGLDASFTVPTDNEPLEINNNNLVIDNTTTDIINDSQLNNINNQPVNMQNDINDVQQTELPTEIIPNQAVIPNIQQSDNSNVQTVGTNVIPSIIETNTDNADMIQQSDNSNVQTVNTNVIPSIMETNTDNADMMQQSVNPTEENSVIPGVMDNNTADVISNPDTMQPSDGSNIQLGENNIIPGVMNNNTDDLTQNPNTIQQFGNPGVQTIDSTVIPSMDTNPNDVTTNADMIQQPSSSTVQQPVNPRVQVVENNDIKTNPINDDIQVNVATQPNSTMPGDASLYKEIGDNINSGVQANNYDNEEYNIDENINDNEQDGLNEMPNAQFGSNIPSNANVMPSNEYNIQGYNTLQENEKILGVNNKTPVQQIGTTQMNNTILQSNSNNNDVLQSRKEVLQNQQEGRLYAEGDQNYQFGQEEGNVMMNQLMYQDELGQEGLDNDYLDNQSEFGQYEQGSDAYQFGNQYDDLDKSLSIIAERSNASQSDIETDSNNLNNNSEDMYINQISNVQTPAYNNTNGNTKPIIQNNTTIDTSLNLMNNDNNDIGYAENQLEESYLWDDDNDENMANNGLWNQDPNVEQTNFQNLQDNQNPQTSVMEETNPNEMYGNVTNFQPGTQNQTPLNYGQDTQSKFQNRLEVNTPVAPNTSNKNNVISGFGRRLLNNVNNMTSNNSLQTLNQISEAMQLNSHKSDTTK